MPIKEVRISGNKLLSAKEVLHLSGLSPGILLSELDPYVTASFIQQHPVVHRADVRREFPHRVHLILHEHIPEVLVERTHSGREQIESHWLVTRERLVLQSVSAERAEDPKFMSFPRLLGLPDQGIRPGVVWNSLPLERGMKFLMTFREWDHGVSPDSSGIHEEIPEMAFDVLNTKRMMLDLNDPMNLKMHWVLPPAVRNPVDDLENGSSYGRTSVVVNLGRKQYPQKLKRFGEILPQLLKEHPEMKSIDKRYPDRVTLVP